MNTSMRRISPNMMVLALYALLFAFAYMAWRNIF